MKEIIIVEGKSDTQKLKQIYKDVITFETSGLGLDDNKIDQLKRLSKEYKLIVFTDPDGPGEKIRNKLNENIDNLHHAFLENDKALSKNNKKVGVEFANESEIKKALNNLYTNEGIQNKYVISDLVNFGIYNNKEKRVLFCNKLNIAFGNNKKIVKQLNSFNIDENKITEVLKEINESS